LRFKIETLEIHLAKHHISIGLTEEIQIPLSPPAERQMVTKPTKFNDLVGFFVYGIPKVFIKYQCQRCLWRCHLFIKKLSDTYQEKRGFTTG
jgi:hypothetical protein